MSLKEFHGVSRGEKPKRRLHFQLLDRARPVTRSKRRPNFSKFRTSRVVNSGNLDSLILTNFLYLTKRILKM